MKDADKLKESSGYVNMNIKLKSTHSYHNNILVCCFLFMDVDVQTKSSWIWCGSYYIHMSVRFVIVVVVAVILVTGCLSLTNVIVYHSCIKNTKNTKTQNSNHCFGGLCWQI